MEDYEMEINYKLSMPDNTEELYDLINSKLYKANLEEIYDKCRALLRYGENVSKDLEVFAEDIKETASELLRY